MLKKYAEYHAFLACWRHFVGKAKFNHKKEEIGFVICFNHNFLQ